MIMTSRLSSATFPDPVAESVYPVKLYTPSKCRTPQQPQPSRWNLEIQLAVALRQVRKLTAENEQLRSDNTQQLEQLQQKDAALQQHDLEAAKLRQQHEKQQMQLAVMEQLLEARPKQQQQPEHSACSMDTVAPAAVAASRPAECTAQPGTVSVQTPAASGVTDGEGCVLLEASDSVEQPQAPSPVDSKPSYSPRSSDSSSSSDDEGSINDSTAAKEQPAPATSSWWWWSPPNTSNIAITKPTSHTTSSSSSESESSIFSSWWMAEQAEDMAIGAADDILYI